LQNKAAGEMILSLLLPIATFWQRELLRFVRQRSRVFGALGQPLLFWLLLGAGLNPSFRPAGMPAHVDYLEYFFPGTLLLILLFTSIFSNISVIEDRREGFLQAALVAPIPSFTLVFGKVLGGATLAVLQAVLFLLLAPVIGVSISLSMIPATLLVLVLLAVSMTALGFAIAWRMESTQGFHVVMNVFMIPMWLLSGAFFPAAGTSPPIKWLMALNPLTYGMSALRQCLYPAGVRTGMLLPAYDFSLTVTMWCTLALLGLALLSRKMGRAPV
jgi:ABC-2 type transport system permease protein